MAAQGRNAGGRACADRLRSALGSACWGVCLTLAAASLWLASSTVLSAQTALSGLVYAVGTTARDSLNQDWCYVLLDASESQVLAGKRFAVYGKTGYPTNAGAFALRGAIGPVTDLAALELRLSQSVALGQNLASLNDALLIALRNVPGIPQPTLAQNLAIGIQMAAVDPAVAEKLSLLGQGNPGVNLCLGKAFSEPMSVTTTYEVRELDPATGSAGDVVGRVTLVPNAPVILPAPGKPFQVVSNQPSEHLLIRLRWGAPAELRRLSVLHVGFNLWRIPRAAAEAGNFHLVPPTSAQLRGNPQFVRANRSAVFTSMDYSAGTGPGAADDPADRITSFFSDSGRGSGSPPFLDGEEFYYFVTARDLLGRDGLVSPGGMGHACRRLPPKAPTNVRVVNTVLPGTTNLPRLQVTWLQNTNADDRISHYWVCRWPNPTMALSSDIAPLDYRVGEVASLPGAALNQFIDTGTGAPATANLSNVWYTVRAVSLAACDPLLSPHAGPAWGVLRQREGPEAATGTLVGSCGTAVVMFQRFATNTIVADNQHYRFRFSCLRRDPGIAWVQFTVTNLLSGVETLGPVYFPPDGDTVQLDYSQPVDVPGQARQLGVGCSVGTVYEQVSAAAACVMNAPFPATQQREAVFFAGQLLASALDSSDPLFAVLNAGQSRCIGPYRVDPDASGMVALQFDLDLGPAALIQAFTNNTWHDVAVVPPDSNRVYWVSFPGCLIGPVPPLRGCGVNLPLEAGCDQHVARASDSGPVAPLRVRFRLTPRTREYRVYRRADDGALSLVGQGAGAFDPANPGKILEVRDDAMPPSPTRLCYFVQLLDEHGNGSPLSLIGCKEVKPATLPRPILAEPQAIGAVENPQVALNWFCPTAGVARFQVKISRVDMPAAGAPSGFASAQLKVFPAYLKTASYLGLTKAKRLGLISFSEAHLTPRLGAGFGPGPQFNLSASVIPNATYAVSVAAMDDQGHVGNASEAWSFTWRPPIVLASVPWPARPLPPLQEFEPPDNTVFADFFPRAAARVFLYYDGSLADRRYPVGIRIGELSPSLFFRAPNTYYYPNVGTNTFIRYSGFSTIVNPDPHIGLFRARSPNAALAGRTLLPLVVYRQQLTNAWYPRVSGDVTQVSPLIERIPWRIDANKEVTIPDRLFAVSEEVYNDHAYTFLYLRDQQPVLAGAKYRYSIVRFDDKREPAEVIPVGEVELPLTP